MYGLSWSFFFFNTFKHTSPCTSAKVIIVVSTQEHHIFPCSLKDFIMDLDFQLRRIICLNHRLFIVNMYRYVKISVTLSVKIVILHGPSVLNVGGDNEACKTVPSCGKIKTYSKTEGCVCSCIICENELYTLYLNLNIQQISKGWNQTLQDETHAMIQTIATYTHSMAAYVVFENMIIIWSEANWAAVILQETFSSDTGWRPTNKLCVSMKTVRLQQVKNQVTLRSGCCSKLRSFDLTCRSSRSDQPYF